MRPSKYVTRLFCPRRWMFRHGSSRNGQRPVLDCWRDRCCAAMVVSIRRISPSSSPCRASSAATRPSPPAVRAACARSPARAPHLPPPARAAACCAFASSRMAASRFSRSALASAPAASHYMSPAARQAAPPPPPARPAPRSSRSPGPHPARPAPPHPGASAAGARLGEPVYIALSDLAPRLKLACRCASAASATTRSPAATASASDARACS